MAGYDIFLSDGDLLTTIGQKTIDNRRNSSLVLIGQGVPNNWQTIDQDLVWLLENFSKSSPPPNPLRGQTWYDSAHDRMNVFDGEVWGYLLSPQTSCETMFDMLDTAIGIDFTQEGSTPIFTVPDTSNTYLALFLLLVPSSSITATTPPTFDVSAKTPGDILLSTTIPIGADNRNVSLSTNASPPMLSNPDGDSAYGVGFYGIGLYSGEIATASINITTAATGGDLRYDAFLYGFVVENTAPIPAAPQSLYGLGPYGVGPYGIAFR